MTIPLATADPSLRAVRRRLSLLVVLLVAPAVGFADSSSVKERTTTKIADGIYVIRHQDAPNGFPQGNTAVIIGDQEVLVVDSC